MPSMVTRTPANPKGHDQSTSCLFLDCQACNGRVAAGSKCNLDMVHYGLLMYISVSLASLYLLSLYMWSIIQLPNLCSAICMKY